MPHRRCLTCLFWLPAYPEDDLRAAERAVEARRGFGAALAGACVAPGRRRHASSRHTCERWTSPAHAHPHAPPAASDRSAGAIMPALPAPAMAGAAAAAGAASVTAYA
jgi:hypothetical protein